MIYTARDIYEAARDGKPLEVETAFESVMQRKINAIMEQMRLELAQNLLSL